ncbi:nitrogen fixation protein NifQ [Sulfurimonas sp. C5]|uniref:nitrogen fixation protein NifQ n=1 Tax=Sulfurimonas sp. C5 TaxID=3036947 RepID=UPI0024537FD7|nr:nitrogen fixation protein NifQ [Sulfurimonas sp. C5]MDH4945483.1 nitrogen fixation protein NifQ [Sulfurimonas sp. C5]
MTQGFMTVNEVLEAKVKLLLEFFSKDDYSKMVVAPKVAKASLEMNHLYQDLGFDNRVEMGRFMQEYFPKLSAMKPKETLWKKYLYDLLNETAPACAECNDQLTCFKCQI